MPAQRQHVLEVGLSATNAAEIFAGWRSDPPMSEPISRRRDTPAARAASRRAAGRSTRRFNASHHKDCWWCRRSRYSSEYRRACRAHWSCPRLIADRARRADGYDIGIDAILFAMSGERRARQQLAGMPNTSKPSSIVIGSSGQRALLCAMRAHIVDWIWPPHVRDPRPVSIDRVQLADHAARRCV